MEKMEYYYFTIPRSPKIQRDWDSITNCIADLNGSCKYLYMDKPFYDLEKPNRVMLRFLYLVKADRKGTPLQEDISELKDIFGCKIELLPIKQHTTPKEVLDALPIAKNLMSAYSGGYIRGNAEFRLILETSKEQLSRTKKMTGFSSFKEAFRRINSLSDRMIELGKRGNYNVVLVNDCGANEFVFSDMLYSLLVGKGIIKDQRIVRGDLDDAVCTSSNTSLFYFIMETWDFGNHDGFRWGIPQEESFRLLSRRKNIYITTMDRAQYEKAQEFDYFKAFFPHTVEIKDLKEEEKVELLKCAAKEYGFTFDAKSFRNSDILKLPYPTLQTQLYSVIQNQLADADNTEFIMHASDFDPLAKKSDKKSNALEELDALIGLDSVKKCVRELSPCLKIGEDLHFRAYIWCSGGIREQARRLSPVWLVSCSVKLVLLRTERSSSKRIGMVWFLNISEEQPQRRHLLLRMRWVGCCSLMRHMHSYLTLLMTTDTKQSTPS